MGVKLAVNPRHGFIARPGRVIISCDFASQETLIAAALSQDPILTRSFTVPKFIRPDGSLTSTEEPGAAINPDSDIHTLSTRAFCFPSIFEGKAPYEWVEIANTKGITPLPGKPRKYGKIVNYFLQYLGSAESLAELCHVEVDQAKVWVKGHQELYSAFHEWTRVIAAKGVARGWIETPWGQRVRWVNESNAKQSGESPARAAVSQAIQGICADVGKLALISVLKKIEGTDIRLCNFVHDEAVFDAPGNAYPDGYEENDEGVWTPKYKGDSQAIETAEMIKETMETVEGRVIDNYLPGAASYEIAPFWQH